MQEETGQVTFVLLQKKLLLYCLNSKCFLKAHVKYLHVQITEGYLSTSQKSLQFSQLFVTSAKLYDLHLNVFA